MSVGWESLPLLPLRCVLEHLSVSDALAAMSVCRHWRNAMLVYEGHKNLLKLRAKHTERNMLLARIFRKHVRRLHIYLDCGPDDLDKLFNIVLPEFYDSVKLTELVFIGASFLQQNYNVPPNKLKRIVTESLVFKNSHCITKFAMIGCEMDVAMENDRYTHEQIEYYSAPLSFNALPTPADSILSNSNSSHMVFSTLQHISVDYDQISTEALETLLQLPMFNYLSLVVHNMVGPMEPIDWMRLANCCNCHTPLEVALHIISLPQRRLNEVMETVLVEGMALVSLNVFFCKTLYAPLLTHCVSLYKSTLRSVVWVDAPADALAYQRVISNQPEFDVCNINPFILLCWQCVNLKRLVIHGYWIWQYDILGFVRLRKTLQHLEISAIYNKQSRFTGGAELTPDSAIRVLANDTHTRVDQQYIQDVNELTEFPWSPHPRSRLHPALRTRASPQQRADYILQEINSQMDMM